MAIDRDGHTPPRKVSNHRARTDRPPVAQLVAAIVVAEVHARKITVVGRFEVRRRDCKRGRPFVPFDIRVGKSQAKSDRGAGGPIKERSVSYRHKGQSGWDVRVSVKLGAFGLN